MNKKLEEPIEFVKTKWTRMPSEADTETGEEEEEDHKLKQSKRTGSHLNCVA